MKLNLPPDVPADPPGLAGRHRGAVPDRGHRRGPGDGQRVAARGGPAASSTSSADGLARARARTARARHHQAGSSLASMLRRCSRLHRSQVHTTFPRSVPRVHVRRAAATGSASAASPPGAPGVRAGVRARADRRATRRTDQVLRGWGHGPILHLPPGLGRESASGGDEPHGRSLVEQVDQAGPLVAVTRCPSASSAGRHEPVTSGSARSNPWSAVSRKLTSSMTPSASRWSRNAPSRASASRSESRAMSDRGPPAWWPASVTTLAHQVSAGAVAGVCPQLEHLLQPDVVDLRAPGVVAVLEVRGRRGGGPRRAGPAAGRRGRRRRCCCRWRGPAPWSSSRPRGRPARRRRRCAALRPAARASLTISKTRAHRGPQPLGAAVPGRVVVRHDALAGRPVVEHVAQHPVPPGPEPGEDRRVVGQRDAGELARPRRRAAPGPRRSAGARPAAPPSRPGAAGRRSGHRPRGCPTTRRRARAAASRYDVSRGTVQRLRPVASRSRRLGDAGQRARGSGPRPRAGRGSSR